MNQGAETTTAAIFNALEKIRSGATKVAGVCLGYGEALSG